MKMSRRKVAFQMKKNIADLVEYSALTAYQNILDQDKGLCSEGIAKCPEKRKMFPPNQDICPRPRNISQTMIFVPDQGKYPRPNKYPCPD